MIRMILPLRTARAQCIIDAIDAAGSSGAIQIWTGGQPEPGTSVDSIPDYTAGDYSAGDYVVSELHYYRATTDGSTGSTVPAFPTAGGTVTDGDIVWQDMGETPRLLGTLALSYPCGTVADGVLIFNAFTQDDSANRSGVAMFGRFLDGDGNPVLDGACGLQGSGALFILNSTSIISGGPIRMNENGTARMVEGGA